MGAPLIRDYCNRANFSLKEKGPYEQFVTDWLMRQTDTELIKLRPILPVKIRIEESECFLTTVETSRLLIETYTALA